ncbi:hypothetical protein BX661DRAFT_176260 [Kickxella alabastrina]|uniref:uncharacterized protein n=1 Tax=Kickxella alabastrina TaxID=61397 RepID=UPI00221E425D|nr:uncharacterized protein BX661DRAFT_176260 [Kickxella alabastrina]KAI7835182.1 hypothetical protein BX661DRAFT_176260 [Kickxella alabastrina]
MQCNSIKIRYTLAYSYISMVVYSCIKVHPSPISFSEMQGCLPKRMAAITPKKDIKPFAASLRIMDCCSGVISGGPGINIVCVSSNL